MFNFSLSSQQQYIVISQTTWPRIAMKVVQTSQKMVHFDNGKTFYVDFSARNAASLCQSQAQQAISQNVHLNFLAPSAPSLFYRSNAHVRCQVENDEGLKRPEAPIFKQLILHSSHPDPKFFSQPRMSAKCSSNVSLDAQTELTISTKKRRIFSSTVKNIEAKRSFTSIKPFNENKDIQKCKQINEIQKSNTTTSPSFNIYFSRKNETNSKQQIPSYQKRSFNIMQDYQVHKKTITTSQPINHQTYSTSHLRYKSVNYEQKLNFIAQVQSKNYIPVSDEHKHPSSSKKYGLNQNGLSNRKESQSLKSSDNVTKSIHAVEKNEKMKHFCEENTIKLKKSAGRVASPAQNISISNIEQDNSFSRYHDTDDQILPILNRISFKNVEIQNKSYEKPDEMVSHNIFVDFQRVPESPALMKRESREIVHFDSKNKKSIISQTLRGRQTLPSTKDNPVGRFVPIFMILTVIILLLVQTLA